ncbi:Endoribonuclease YbeY [Mesoplasma sp. JKS002658]|uniref:rRNA maturation RNase YbeY n=1 Tax=Mesoplasma whartonense TaxID=2878854 RepID=UPI002022B60E|nr:MULTISPECIES: rRNA maturation RNase YbeY [unclassified Mesoplasma]MCL8211140.1 Endoribonuclease YbeY [Mesoplasma sp. JKS002664]MCL8211801.1 Endoribonuclease YbeY [Mesoplasma sp. JKS002662]MCL8212661.1 Endoribonuclease YbeY [Mesoplasma sp. JKS002661]MCL8213217.1 Endoribonuclease YbeY [Mesoplasma sp. JKS002660]MCL8214094.1 Endoribonuclease YbeY [Mesoplasma sp. JKS002658]
MSEISFLNKTSIAMMEWEKLYQELLVTGIKILGLKDNLTLAVIWVVKSEALLINQKYRKEEYVPDVISFPLTMSADVEMVVDEHELGDLFVCYEVAQQKAIKYHHKLREEMAFLFVHGFLHLLGYDHEKSSAQEEQMFLLQAEILKAAGINYEVIYDEESYLA